MSIERVSLGKRLIHKEDPETGLPLDLEPMVWSEEEEVRATGEDCHALMGALRESSDRAEQQAEARSERLQMDEITSPEGKLMRVPEYARRTFEDVGYGKRSGRATFTVQGFGGLRRAGLRRQKIRYRNGEREIIEEE